MTEDRGEHRRRQRKNKKEDAGVKKGDGRKKNHTILYVVGKKGLERRRATWGSRGRGKNEEVEIREKRGDIK